MGLGKAFCKIFNSSEQLKEATEIKCGPDARQVRSQSTPSSRQPRTRSLARPAKPTTSAIPTQNVYRMLSRQCLRFDDAITKTSLSHVLLWYLYWDIVEMPVDSEYWYKDYGDQEEMFGWIRLGYEMDQFGLQSPRGLQRICTELGIDVEDVRRRLMRISKPRAMTKTEIAEYGMDVIMGASFYIRKLSKDKALVIGLQPEPHTRWTRTQSRIFDQLDLYQETLLQPAIQGVFPQRPGNLIAAQRRDKARTDWNRLGGIRPLPSPSIYQRVLSPSCPDSGFDSREPQSSRFRAREPPSRPRFADNFPDEQPNIDRKLIDSQRRSPLPLDDLANLANRMNTQMTMNLDALASTLMDRLSQLQDEIIRQLRDQWQQNLTAAMQQLHDANHALVETDNIPSALMAPSNITPISAQYPPHRHYPPPKDQPLEPFPPFDTHHKINLQSEPYRHESPNVGTNLRRTIRNASASPHIEAHKEMPPPNNPTYEEDDLPGQAVLRATRAVLEAKRRATGVE